MVRRGRKAEGFNLAFLDIMSCGLGAVVLVFMLVKHNVGQSVSETELLMADVQRLEQHQAELQDTLAGLQDISASKAEKIARQKARLTQLEQELSRKELGLARKKEQLAALKNDISTRPVAAKDDLVEDDRGGEENYLMGLKVSGRRIALMLDSSSSMTDEKLIDIIKRKNGSAAEKRRGPKWLRAKKTVRWLLARLPRASEVTVISYNAGAKALGSAAWLHGGDPTAIKSLYQELDSLVPEGATNLQKGLQVVSDRQATDLYVITDGLPTVGESRYASLNPFANCSSLLGRSATISGECRVKLFRQSIRESSPAGVTVNVILLPIEGDPDAVNEYWVWAAQTGGLLISPAVNWP